MTRDPHIIVHLMPQPAGRQSVSDPEQKKTPKSKPKATPGKRARNAPNVPQELKDCHQQTADGKPICWAGLTTCQVVANPVQV